MTPPVPPLDLDAIDALVQAATPGPWSWTVNPKSHAVSLDGRGHGNEVVMGFRRWGMGGAQPIFRKVFGVYSGKPLRTLADLCQFIVPIEGREHHASWAQTIDQPDANFIAAARTLVPALVARVRELEADAKSDPDVKVRVSPELLAELQADWSAPVRIRVHTQTGNVMVLGCQRVDVAELFQCGRCRKVTRRDDVHTCSPQGRAEETT